jgi:hypothetical protein
MPIRRLNFTKRRRIARDDVDIVVHEDTSPPNFDVQLKLASYGFPSDARVFVEAYRQTTLLRFDFGTTGATSQPADMSLAAFESAAAIRFRVRVTSASDQQGLLIGLADKIPGRNPEDKPDKRHPLLPSRPDDLGEELWRVEFGSDTTYLVINNQLPDWKETARDPWFRAAVFPAAMRRILERILLVEKHTDTDDEDWRSRWLQFASSLPGSGPVPRDSDEYNDWVEDATAAFARRARLRTNCKATGGNE